MNKFRLVFLILLIALASFLAGGWFRSKSSSQSIASRDRRILYYVDPMHPAYKSDKPGISPDCGMELVPVYADGGLVSANSNSSSTGETVLISTEKQQVIGLRVSPVESSSGSRTVRLLGRVTADERRLYKITAAVDGWIQETYSDLTGSLVKKNQPLASFYSPEFLGAEQAYLFALGALDRFQPSGKETPEQIALTKAGIQQAADGLRNLGMSETQISDMVRTRRLTQQVLITAPSDGFVLTRNVSTGQRFERGTELYRIADLSRIWVLAGMPEEEAVSFRPGTFAKVMLPRQEKALRARVSEILPQFDPASRTMKVRLELENPDYALRPDMFVDVDLPLPLRPGLSVPVEAVLDSGRRRTVFVDRGNGLFERREVKTGWQTDDRVEVVEGLRAGERVVVDGNFYVDSESRLKAAAAGIYSAAVKDPICGMMIDQSKATAAGRKAEYRGTTYYFCSDRCRREFEQDPARSAWKFADKLIDTTQETRAAPTPSAKREFSTVMDPFCGMPVDPKKAAAAGLQSEYRGVTYYFCSQGCKRNFDKEPERYLRNSSGAAHLSHASGAERGFHD
jgi:RND family efflux transporter MFP subunit